MGPGAHNFIMKNFGLVLEYKQRLYAYVRSGSKKDRVLLRLTLRKLKRRYGNNSISRNT